MLGLVLSQALEELSVGVGDKAAQSFQPSQVQLQLLFPATGTVAQ